MVGLAVLLVVGRRRGPAERLWQSRPLPMLFCLGVMLSGSDAARLRGWTGTGMAVVSAVGELAAVAAVALAVLSPAARATARKRSATCRRGQPAGTAAGVGVSVRRSRVNSLAWFTASTATSWPCRR